jgi:glycosyltransferase involved in cell wall biosynthesis
MLDHLSSALVGHEERVEVVISDNHSSDDTPVVIASWLTGKSRLLSAKTFRQETNVGVSKNLVFTLYSSSAKYFMPLGDDDMLNAGNIGRLLGLLLDKQPSAVIQATCAGKLLLPKAGPIGFFDAASLFYEYGNAWAGIVDRAASIKALDSRVLREQVEEIVWPQTVFGFLAMYDLAPARAIEAVDYEIGRPLTESLTIPNKSYWIRSFADLLKAVAILQACTKSKIFRRRFLAFESRGMRSHVWSILFSSLVDGDTSSLVGLRVILSNGFGLRGLLLSCIFALDDMPRLLELFMRLAYGVSGKKKKASFSEFLSNARADRQKELSMAPMSCKRYGDWF